MIKGFKQEAQFCLHVMTNDVKLLRKILFSEYC